MPSHAARLFSTLVIAASFLMLAASTARAVNIVVIQDESDFALGISNPGGIFSPANEPGPDANQSYLHDGGPGEFTWIPGLNLFNTTVDVSWGANFNHSPDVDYFFDPDGAGPAPEISLLQNVNQTLLADQLTPGGNVPVEWSGFLTIGTNLTLVTESIFRVTGSGVSSAPSALNTAAWQFTSVVPEPSTFLLVSLALGMAGSRRIYRARRQLNLHRTAALALVLMLLIVPMAHAGVVITPSAGYTITYDGNDGLYFDAGTTPSAPVSQGGLLNIALAANGATAFSDGDLVVPHITANINNGLYSNNQSWISDADATSFAGVDFIGTDVFRVSSVAWGRDNGNSSTDGCGVQCTDRNLGIYTLQRTLVPNPNDLTADTGDAETGWDTVGTLNYQSSEDGVVGSLFTGYFRHEFALGGGLLATGLRLLVPDGNAIDEFEAFGVSLVPEPSTFAMLGLGLVGLTIRRRRGAFAAATQLAPVLAVLLAMLSIGEVAQAGAILPGSATGNLQMHLFSGQGVSTSGANVTSWADLSGNGNNATTASDEPTLVPFALQGKPAIRFTGANNDHMDLPTSGALGIQNSSYEMFFVARSAVTTTQFLLSGAGVNFEIHLDGSAGQRFIPGPGFTAAQASDLGANGDYTGLPLESHVFSVRVDSSNSNFAISRVDGVDTLDVSAASAINNSNVALLLGQRADGSLDFTGDFFEILIYDRSLTGAERFQVENYLNQRWVNGDFSVPEPSTFTLALVGLTGLIVRRRRREGRSARKGQA